MPDGRLCQIASTSGDLGIAPNPQQRRQRPDQFADTAIRLGQRPTLGFIVRRRGLCDLSRNSGDIVSERRERSNWNGVRNHLATPATSPGFRSPFSLFIESGVGLTRRYKARAPMAVFRSSGLPVFRSSGLPVFRADGDGEMGKTVCWHDAFPSENLGQRWRVDHISTDSTTAAKRRVMILEIRNGRAST